ncbi:MAG: hypothetical protein ABFS86_18700, partial [Planctomycetota bacterium]
MKRWIPVVVVLLILLLAFLNQSEWWETHPGPAPEAPAPEVVDPGVVPPEVVPGTVDPEGASPAPAGGAGEKPDATLPTAGVPAPEAGTKPDGAGGASGDPGKETPAVRRNPRDPPPPTGPRFGPGGSRPPFGPTGQWEKFPPEIPRGRATITVRILDSSGRPIPGAEAWLGPPDIRGNPAVSYAHLRKLGKADAKGVITATRLPAGAATLAGNLLGLLNGPRGLDARSAIAVTLVDDRTVEVELKLPLSLTDMGRVAGIVRGPGGDPLRNAAVM